MLFWHSKSSDNASIMSSSTIAPSDYTAGSSTVTLAPKSSSKDSKGGSGSKDKVKKAKKEEKKKKGDEPRLPPICLQIVFA
jgi:hypothetical protein